MSDQPLSALFNDGRRNVVTSPKNVAKNVVDVGQHLTGEKQGSQCVYFQTKNPNLAKFFRALYWKMLIYFRAIGKILRTFGKFYDPLLYFVLIRCIHFSGFWYHVPTEIWQPWRED
jgi:hypothetical protein